MNDNQEERTLSIKPGRRVVGRDGPPTPETAPWGVRYWPEPDANGGDGYAWLIAAAYISTINWTSDTEWEPLPEPSTEYVSAPEPKPRWSHDRGFIKCSGSPIDEAEVNAAVAALNTLDRDGVVYGPGRPMEELPEAGYVLVWRVKPWRLVIGHPTAVRRYPDDYGGCWWPLPVPEDTNA